MTAFGTVSAVSTPGAFTWASSNRSCRAIDLRHRSRELVRRQIAERAEACSALLMDEMMRQPEQAQEKPSSSR